MKNRFFLAAVAGCFAIGCLGFAGAQQAQGDAGAKDMGKTITVGQGAYAGNTNAAIQKAVDDAAAAGGGTVIVPRGTYRMHDALHLRSNVRVVGREGAVLKKVPSVTSLVADFVGYGHYEVTVAEPQKFRVGMGVHILDDKSGGFYTTVATVIGRKDDALFLDRMLNHDYMPRDNARVISVYSLVEGTGVHDASVEGLTLDGNYPRETFRLNGCRGGGVFLILCQRVRIVNVEVRTYNGDAVSFQQCTDILVDGCHLHHNAGHGLHPGSGTVRYVMRRVRSDHNGGCGIYYCLRTTHSILEDCQLLDNAENGISIGTRDSDHLIQRNTIRDNALAGVLFRQVTRRGGDRTILRENTIGPDCGKEGTFEVFLTNDLTDVLIEANRIDPGHHKAMRVEGGCTRIYFVGNTVSGRPQRRGQVRVARGNDVSFEAPQDFPPVGPAALPADGAMHLGIAKLAPWREP